MYYIYLSQIGRLVGLNKKKSMLENKPKIIQCDFFWHRINS